MIESQPTGTEYLKNSLIDCEQALTAFADGSEVDWQKACRNVGNVLQGLGRFEESAIWNSFALETEPDFLAIYANLGKLYTRYHYWEKAIAIYQQLIQSYPGYLEAYWSLAHIYMAQDNEPELINVYYQLGTIHAKAKQWEKAIEFFERVTAMKPDFAEAFASLAQIYHQLGKKEQEVAHWYEAFRHKPDKATPEVLMQLGQVLQEQGKIQEAFTTYQQGVANYPEFLPFYYGMAEILTYNRQWQEAIACYEAILERNNQEARAYHQLGKLALQQREYSQALEFFKRAIELNPDFPWAYRDLVKTLTLMQEWDEVIKTCQGIIALVKEHAWAYVHMGNAWREKGNLAKANACYLKAAELRGWYLCAERNYQFTFDDFTFKIQHYQSVLSHLVYQPNINVLEIGVTEGMSSCWLLDNILTHNSAKLTCIDTKFIELFQHNINQTSLPEKVTKLEGSPHILLSLLEPNYFDAILLQDRMKNSDHIAKDSALSWKILKKGGILIFNDYNTAKLKSQTDNPSQGIYRFLNSITEEFVVIQQVSGANQLIVKKLER